MMKDLEKLTDKKASKLLSKELDDREYIGIIVWKSKEEDGLPYYERRIISNVRADTCSFILYRDLIINLQDFLTGVINMHFPQLILTEENKTEKRRKEYG